MKIKNYLKNKQQLLLLLLFFSVFALAASIVQAASIEYTPNITIPGSKFIGGQAITITPNSFAEYIRDIYRYAGVIAGAFAMFMLVYGAWQWLMAGGNASKIAMAKETVTTTLIGLAFLFGGYLLLSQISVNLVNFQSPVIEEPYIAPNSTCQALDATKTCADYAQNQQACNNNACFNQNGFREVCFYKTVGGYGGDPGCYSLGSGLKACDKNRECNFDINGDGSSDYCCADVQGNADTCSLISEANQTPKVGCGSD